MKKLAYALLLITGTLFAQEPVANNLMPQPAQLTAAAGRLALTPTFSVATTAFTDARLQSAITRTLMQLRQKTALEIKPSVTAAGDPTLSIAVQGAGQPIQSVDEDESYTLTISATHADLKAPTVVGAIHGLQTLLQLVQSSGSSYVLPAVTIADAPRFPWRGLMIDCGRHFEPIPVLKRNLDAMAAVKLNVFHWHLTEDQGFRIESKVYPKLTALGSDGLFYTQQEAIDLVAYARARGIRVVPEFEMPGHSTAWLVAYPELASARAPSAIRREFGISDYALDPTREETYAFIDRFLTEMVTLFPDPYLHIGGDETVSPEWKSDPRILAFMKAHQLKDPDALQAYFNRRVLAILTRLHRHMVGWDEILNPALPKDVIVQSWRGQASLDNGAQQGYQGILSAGYYLDGMQPAGKHYLVDPDPASAPLTPGQRKLILGGEVAMWAEQLDQHTIDSRIWPRTAAIAERFWSPESITNVDDMYRRLDKVSVDLELPGLHHLDQEEAQLRNLAGTQHIDALRTFAAVLEPVSFSDRYDEQHTSQLTVLDRVVDALRPDPPSKHAIDQLTRTFLAAPQQGTGAQQALTTWFQSMIDCTPEVERQMAASPRLADARKRAQQLPILAKAGLEALTYISSNQKAPAGWKVASLAAIADARKPSAIIRFTFLDPLAALVTAVRE